MAALNVLAKEYTAIYSDNNQFYTYGRRRVPLGRWPFTVRAVSLLEPVCLHQVHCNC